MKVEEVKCCSFENWYHNFKRITIESFILPLPEGFLEYILKDGIVLPQRNDSSDDSTSEGASEYENEEVQSPNFAEFDKRIKEAIDKLGGKVFPKLNWSSPRDASWIAFNNSCCCTSVSDIYLLLKSSDFIIHDITNAFLHCEDYVPDGHVLNSLCQPHDAFYLILRKWTEIETSGEFRCFVKEDNLIGICQREYSLYFDHIDVHKDSIVKDIESFFKENIQQKFSCSDYVFDVYRKRKGKIYILDFNPFGIVTDALLFSWNELNGSFANQNDCLPVFRYVDGNHGVQPHPLGFHAIPQDIIDISTGEDSFKLVDLIKLKLEEQERECLSDDKR